jgi:hypothetical protein
MDDFACQIAAGEKFPSLAFDFKPLDPTVLKHHLPMPKCVKLTFEGSVYSVVICFDFGHRDSLGSCAAVFATTMPATEINNQRLKIKQMTPEGGSSGANRGWTQGWGARQRPALKFR